MQNTVSNKVRLLLNELAILNQPELNEGNYLFNVDTLKRIKTLSAELYLSSDLLLKGDAVVPSLNMIADTADIETPVAEIKDVPAVNPDVIADDKPAVNTEMPIPENKPQNESEIFEESVAEIVEIDEPDDEEIITVEDDMPSVEPAITHTTSSDAGAGLFDGKISLTRRFEYTNNLFGGDAGAFAGFLSQVAMAANRDAALDIFGREYELRNWKRRDETADDLRQLIKKYKN